jgi:hypothetical protein
MIGLKKLFSSAAAGPIQPVQASMTMSITFQRLIRDKAITVVLPSRSRGMRGEIMASFPAEVYWIFYSEAIWLVGLR